MRNERERWDLSTFGYRELDMAADTLKAIANHGYPDDFDDEGVRLEFNPFSGEVYLTNENGDCCMEANGELFSWYYLGYHGYEGFLDDLIDQYDSGYIKSEDWEELAQICEDNGNTEKAEEIRAKLKEVESNE